MKKTKSKKVRRIVIGTGHPWFVSTTGYAFDSIALLKSDGGTKKTINTHGLGGWNKVRLVLEVIK